MRSPPPSGSADSLALHYLEQRFSDLNEPRNLLGGLVRLQILLEQALGLSISNAPPMLPRLLALGRGSTSVHLELSASTWGSHWKSRIQVPPAVRLSLPAPYLWPANLVTHLPV